MESEFNLLNYEEDFINRHHGMDVPDGKCAGCADPGRLEDY